MRTHECRKYIGTYNLTAHATTRLKQRGLSTRQIELVLEHGIPVEDGYVITNSVVSRRMAVLKQEIKDMERLKNVTVIDLNGEIVTAYRVSDRRIRRMTSK